MSSTWNVRYHLIRDATRHTDSNRPRHWQPPHIATKVAETPAAIEEAIGRSERLEERWCIAELLRLNGSLVLLPGTTDARANASTLFEQALQWARLQGALSWELRAAMALARPWQQQAQDPQARELLGPIYNRFTEGFTTVDLTEAQTLIDSLG